MQENIGKVIKEIRKAKGISAFVLGEMIGVSQQAISQYENGKRKISFEVLNNIAKALNVPMDTLLFVNHEAIEQKIAERGVEALEKEPSLFNDKTAKGLLKLSDDLNFFESFLESLGYHKETLNTNGEYHLNLSPTSTNQITDTETNEHVILSGREYLEFYERISRVIDFEFNELKRKKDSTNAINQLFGKDELL